MPFEIFDDMNFSSSGRREQLADDKELFITEASRALIRGYEAVQNVSPLQIIEPVVGSKAKSFDLIGDAYVEYFQKGAAGEGQIIPFNQKTIYLDDFTNSDTWNFDLDEIMSQYNLKLEELTQLGMAVGRAGEINTLTELIKGARSAALISTGFGGSVVASDDFLLPDMTARGQAILDGLKAAAVELDNKNVPADMRFGVLHNADYYAIVNNETTHKQITMSTNGGVDTGTVFEYMGIRLMKSNFLPTTNIAQGTYTGRQRISPTTNYFHYVDASKTRAIVFRAGATVQLVGKPLTLEMQDFRPRKSTYLAADAVHGHGFLRPEHCVELALDTLTNA